jgi:hypothetical protein
MINRKADLMNNVLTVIIAVVGMAILLFAAVKLYSVYANSEAANAKRTANTVQGKIDIIDPGETANFAVRGGDNWFLSGWDRNDNTRPERCYFYSCICVCEGYSKVVSIATAPSLLGTITFVGVSLGKRKELCDAKGYCRTFKDATVQVLGAQIVGFAPPSYNPQSSSLYYSSNMGRTSVSVTSIQAGTTALVDNRIPVIKFEENLVGIYAGKTIAVDPLTNKNLDVITVNTTDSRQQVLIRG